MADERPEWPGWPPQEGAAAPAPPPFVPAAVQAQQAQVQAQAAQQPAVHAKPIGDLAQWSVVLLAVAAGTSLLHAGAAFYDASTLEGYDSTDEALTAMDGVLLGTVGLDFLVTLGCAIVFIIWFHRAYRNVLALGAPLLRYKTWWAIGGWFIPIMWFFRPKQIVNDIWRGSDPDRERVGEGWAKWTSDWFPVVFTWWWTAWIVCQLLGNRSAIMGLRDGEDAYRTSAQLDGVGALLSVVAAILAIVVVRKITARQEERMRVVNERAWAQYRQYYAPQ